MRKSRQYGSVRGALRNERPYREHTQQIAPVAREATSLTPKILDGPASAGARAAQACL